MSRKEYMTKWRAENLDKLRADAIKYWWANREHSLQVKAVYRQKAKALRAEHQARRRARSKQATPSWADKSKIKEIYDLAREFRDFGLDVHVDHILPLKGERVSGLHVEHNLRLCLAINNLRKKNSQ